MKLQGITQTPILSPSKQSLESIGLTGIFIFYDTGIPIFLRNYSKSKSETFDSLDELIFTAFISSLASYIKTYDESDGYLKGFSTSTNQYYIKEIEDTIYCLVLNPNIYTLGTGIKLRTILDTTLEQLIKSFAIYYRMTRTKEFIEKSFLDTFENQIDTLLMVNLKNTKEKNFLKNSFSQDLLNSKEFHSDTFNYKFLKNGILGIFILNSKNKPIIIRDYVINQKYIKQADYYQRIVLTLKNTYFLGGIKDIGIEDTRVILKINTQYTICLIISENSYWKYDLERFGIYLNELLKDLPLSKIFTSKFSYNDKNQSIEHQINQSKNYQIDQWLFDNLLSANQRLTIK